MSNNESVTIGDLRNAYYRRAALVSRRHATFTISNGRARLVERSSSGTFVSMGPGPEVFVRREDILLFGSGVYLAWTEVVIGDAQVLHYEIVSD